MRHLTIGVFVLMAISACKKDRSCTCVKSITTLSSEPNFVQTAQPTVTTTTLYPEVRKNDARLKNCSSTTITEERNYNSNSSGTMKEYKLTIVTDNQCTLK